MKASETANDVEAMLHQLRGPETRARLLMRPREAQVELVESLLALMNDLIDGARWEDAWQTASVAEELVEHLQDHRLLAEVTFRRGIWHYHRGDLLNALGAWGMALEGFEAAQMPEGIANCRCNIGILYKDMGRTQEARQHLQQALITYQELQHELGQAASRTNLGLVLRVQGQLAAAKAQYEAALPLYRKLQDREGEAAVLGNLGLVSLGMGKFRDSVDYQRQAEVINREIGNRKGIAAALGNQGSAYAEMGEVDNAERCYLAAMTIDRELDNPLEIATDLLNLAQLYLETGALAPALAHANEARHLYESRGRVQGVLETTALLSQIYRLLGDSKRAIASAQRALALAQKLGHRHQEATIWTTFSLLHKDRGTWEEASACQTKAFELYQLIGDRDGQAVSLLNLGMILNRLGQPQEGMRLLEQARAINQETGDKVGEVTCIAQMGVILREEGQLSQALALQTEALEKAVTMRNPDIVWRVRLGRATTYIEMEAFAEAQVDLYEAITQVELVRASLGHRSLKATFFGADKVTIYQRLVLLLALRLQKSAEALRVAEQSRSRLLLDDLALRPVELGDGQVMRHQEEELRLLVELERLQATSAYEGLTLAQQEKLAGVTQALDALWEMMAEWAPGYVILRQGEALDYMSLREMLNER